MQELRGTIFLAFFLALSVWPQNAQQNGEKPSLQQLANATKEYFRDSTEIPLEQETTYQVFDVAGHMRKTAGVSVEYMFKGYNPRRKSYSGEVMKVERFHQLLPSISAIRGVINSDASWIMGISLFLEQAMLTHVSVAYTMRFDETDPSSLPMTAVLAPIGTCPTPTMERKPDYYVLDNGCGPLAIQLREDLSVERFTFEANGLPVQVNINPFHRTTLQHYRVEAEFHEVMLPEDSQPVVVPKRVTTTVETAKGNIVITSVYTPKPASIIH